MIERATVQDSRLSWAARGMLAYLLSLPPDWKIKVEHLQSQGDLGRDAVRGVLKELQRLCYVSGFGQAERVGRGRLVASEIMVYESPDLNPHLSAEAAPETENPSPVAPSPDSPSPVITSPYKRKSQQREQETEQTPTPRAHSRARLPAARAARSGGGGSHLSRFDFQTQCLPWAEAVKAIDPSIRSARALARARWMDSTSDDEIAIWLEARTRGGVTRSLQSTHRPQMSLRTALSHLDSLLRDYPQTDIASAVAQLDVSEDTRAQLLAHDFSKGRKAASA
jgi:hypothetical protein